MGKRPAARDVENALQKALNLAKMTDKTDKVYYSQLFYAFLTDESEYGLMSVLKQSNMIPIDVFVEKIKDVIANLPKIEEGQVLYYKNNKHDIYSPSLNRILDVAAQNTDFDEYNYADVVLNAYSINHELSSLFKEFHLQKKKLGREIEAYMVDVMFKDGVYITTDADFTEEMLIAEESSRHSKKGDGKEKRSEIDAYTTNITKSIIKELENPCIGRDKELVECMTHLKKFGKNSIVLLGDAGVGKTKLVDGLAWCYHKYIDPTTSFYELNLAAMMAGTTYRGMFEERANTLLKTLTANKGQIVLFIDELHTITGAGEDSKLDFSNILKPYLASGKVTVIGATTYEEYKLRLEKDKAIKRRFQPIHIEELDKENTIHILRKLSEKWKQISEIEIDEKALDDIYWFCDKYLVDLTFPDKAITVLDELYARKKISNTDFFTKFTNNNVSNEKRITSFETRQYLTTKYGVNLEPNISRIKSEAIGQESIIDEIVQKLKLKHLLNQKGKPKGSFLFAGRQGSRKSTVAKLLGKEFYGDKGLIVVDCAQYSEAMSINDFLGSPKGYVGYESGVSVLDKIKKQKRGILVFENIDKAHTSFQDLLLRPLSEGRILDREANDISVEEFTFIFTTNAISTSNKIAFGTNSNTTINSSRFSRDFLGKMEYTFMFNPPNTDTLKKVYELKAIDYGLNEAQIAKFISSVDFENVGGLDGLLENFVVAELGL